MTNDALVWTSESIVWTRKGMINDRRILTSVSINLQESRTNDTIMVTIVLTVLQNLGLATHYS